jgi:hypothetical protein
MPTYAAFGLNLSSELELPELPAATTDAVPDVRIRLGPVPERLPDAQAGGVLYQTAPARFLLALEHTRFLVQDGSDIRFDRLEQRPEQLRVFLLGSCLGALLHQRGLLPLHGSAIRTPRGAVVFLGHSGAGKSTLLGAMLQRGHALLADDVAAVRITGEGQPLVEPAIPRLRLWADSAERLGYLPALLQQEQPELEKYILPPPEFAPGAAPLHRIYVLHADHLATAVQLERLAPA